jgi:peptidyl-prolyl cis-trans isomerase B (cyclophilin B)
MATVILHTNRGAIHVELDPATAPKTVKNFLAYAKNGFYNGTVFHRVINNFMIQGGGFSAEMQQKTGNSPIENEADIGLKNNRGTIAMARTSDPHSASSQFFINVADNGFLNHKDKTTNGWGYCAFGQVSNGMDVVDKIKAVKTTSRAGHQDVPVDDVLIERVEVIE